MTSMEWILLAAGLALAAILGSGFGWMAGYLRGYDEGREDAEDAEPKETIPAGATCFGDLPSIPKL
jgi:hypothetical protein